MQHAVLVDVRTKHLGYAFLYVITDKVTQQQRAILLPSVDRYLAVAGIGPQDNVFLTEVFYPPGHKVGLGYGGAAYGYH